MTDKMPKFMDGDEHIGKEEALRDDPQFWEARALLFGQYKDDPDRLAQMVHSTTFRKAHTLGEWRSMMGEYPDTPLADGEMTRYANEDVPVRAFMLKQAVLSLFDLCEAPARLRADLELLFDSFLVNPAWAKARAQALRLANPNATWQEICDLANVNYRQLMADKKEWIIAHNREDVGPSHGSTP